MIWGYLNDLEVRRLRASGRREMRKEGASAHTASRRAIEALRWSSPRMEAAIRELAARALAVELADRDPSVVDAEARLAALERKVQQAEWRLRTLEQQERRAVTRTGRREVVYFMDFGPTVKIGKTRDLDSRVRSLKPRAVLAIEPGYTTRERELHERFAHLRVRIPGDGGTEHFSKSQELTDYIANLATNREEIAA